MRVGLRGDNRLCRATCRNVDAFFTMGGFEEDASAGGGVGRGGEVEGDGDGEDSSGTGSSFSGLLSSATVFCS